ncbi:GNAT family N-acetyltransferase [Amycolatopsis rubida]|uniref:GNAT family N-acetyltransferase n=1 Tax=Amycolatopsis rubida TaxID=112413 RepID=A0ABX0C0S4_9PSEU|nr:MULTISPECIES: GNAT family N-acetyltransferase [Amycolatopsis]MYW94746.1 GNAT family N-acetyltransferase [Amycolatopsis rubida]NEC59733.1 GNAT family N-acetyltransferase [Amycolatopsis rubida]OAP24514.1 Acetyltransferase (GNAT) family protein [Amycolatopsis sp. M39]
MHNDVTATGHAARIATVDALLPAPLPFEVGGDSVLLSAEVGDTTAAGLTTCTGLGPDSPQSMWRALVEHRLEVQLAGPDPAAGLDALLTRWDEHLRSLARVGDTECAAVLSRPSRDTAGATELLRHGFAPVGVLAVRPAQRMAAGPDATPGVCIRHATPDDLSTAVALQLELQRYDAQFGRITLRPGVEELITKELLHHLERPEPQVWIAELYGQPLGMVVLQMPDETGWIRHRVAASRVGYLSSLAVSEAARSSGVGTALAAHAHQVFDEAGADVVLLHHAVANPRSTPFWYAQGYRPLWTGWQRRPAVRSR